MLPLSSFWNRDIRMKYKDLRDFIAALGLQGELKRITAEVDPYLCLLYTSPSPRDRQKSRMPSSA